MRFEVVNPSDYCTMDAPDLKVAAVAVILFGEGYYGLTGIDCNEGVPVFIFGGHEAWFSQQFGIGCSDAQLECLNTRRKELVAALESVALPPNTERSSMNDICGRAHAVAQRVRQLPEVL